MLIFLILSNKLFKSFEFNSDNFSFVLFLINQLCCKASSAEILSLGFFVNNFLIKSFNSSDTELKGLVFKFISSSL